ncbi:MAG: hypothetical protein OXB93_04600, partial [Cytophagales bacterium]|nr:hypothetical protein [Cytophagales bacterium]
MIRLTRIIGFICWGAFLLGACTQTKDGKDLNSEDLLEATGAVDALHERAVQAHEKGDTAEKDLNSEDLLEATGAVDAL